MQRRRACHPQRTKTAKPLAREAGLVVVEFDVWLVQQTDVEREREVAVRALQEREARVPAMQIALQLDHVLAELLGVYVIGRRPRRRPMLRGAEAQTERELLIASQSSDERAQRVGARTDAGPRIGNGPRELLRARPPEWQRLRAAAVLIDWPAGRWRRRRPSRLAACSRGGGGGPPPPDGEARGALGPRPRERGHGAAAR